MSENQKTLILGASPNPARYAFAAAQMLHQRGYEFVPVGIKQGEVLGHPIRRDKEPIPGIHTITLYIGPQHQPEWQDYILETAPQRLIFNPGTENPQLRQRAESQGIQPIQACTLVMLSTGQF